MARRRKNKPTLQATEPSEATSGVSFLSNGLVIAILITIVLGGIPFGMGKYIEFKSPGPFDSGAYVYSAKHLLDGAQLGVDEQTSANTCTLLANVIGVKLFGFNDSGPKVIQMILQLAGLVFMFYTMQKVFGSIAATVGTVVASVYLSAPLIAKFGNVKEQFMIPFMIAAACCWILSEFSKKRFWLILCGMFVILPYYFKPTGLSISIALAIYLVIQGIFERNLKSFMIRLGLIYLGACIGLCLPASLYLWQGQLHLLWNTTPVFLLKISLVLVVIYTIGLYLLNIIKKVQLFSHLKKISMRLRLTGLSIILLMLISCVLYIRVQPGYVEGDTTSYIKDIVFISLPLKVINTLSNHLNLILQQAGIGKSGYLAESRAVIKFDQLAPKVMRYYKALSVPILLAIGSILTALIVWGINLRKKMKPEAVQTHFVWLLAIWWILDMAFVWISPRSYEQYYLPLCGSAAMLSGLVVWQWTHKLKTSSFKLPWVIAGLVVTVTLGCLTIPIFIGQRYSPDTGTDYIKAYKTRRRGYAQALDRVKNDANAPWQKVGDHIRTHSVTEDTIYVWGWVPGIYVQAQRMAPVPKAFDGNMHVTPPWRLRRIVTLLVEGFEQSPPKFIVDTRKRHIPWNRPPLELWPIVPPKMFGNEKARLLRNIPQEITVFDTTWANILEKQVEPDEAKRFEAMKPFRDFVMNNYRVAGQYGEHLLFERK